MKRNVGFLVFFITLFAIAIAIGLTMIITDQPKARPDAVGLSVIEKDMGVIDAR